MEQTGAFYPLAHQDPLVMARLAESIYTMFGFQGIRVPFDLCVESEALGCEIRMRGKPPFPYVAKPLEGPLSFFPVPEDLFQQGRFPLVFQCLKYLRKKYDNRIPLYAGTTAPFTLGGYLWEAKGFLQLPFRDPARLEAILAWLATLVGDYANRLLEAGANVIVLLDPTSSGNMISPNVFERFLLPVYHRLAKTIQGRIILHICGDTNRLLRFIQQTGFSGFSFEGPVVTIKAAREALGDRMAMIGNIATSDILLLGNQSQVREEVRRALSEGVHILAPACAIPPETPPGNLLAMREAWEDYMAQARLG